MSSNGARNVVEACILGGKSPVRAWRQYRGLLQKQVAGSLKISQAAASQMEKPETIKKIARALKIEPEQLDF